MGFTRRGFLKVVAGASAGIMFTPLPWKLLDDVTIWSQNWSWIPRNPKGKNTFSPVVSKVCPSGVAGLVRVVGDNPVRLLPRPDHPLGGGLTALAAAEVEMLHSPSRVLSPLKRSSSGGYIETTWEDAAHIFFEALQKADAKVAFVSGDETGSTSEIISAVAKSLGSEDVFFMPSEGTTAAAAAKLMGLEGQLGYDLENSDFILALGANILETWGPVVATRKKFFAKRAHPGQQNETGITLAYAGAVQNNTACAADFWLPIMPGTEEVFALGIASELIAKGHRIDTPDFMIYQELCAEFTLEKTAEVTGVSVESIKKLIQSLLVAKSPLIIAGSAGGGGTGASPVVAAMGLNALFGNINRKGGVTILPDAPRVFNEAQTRREISAKDFSHWVSTQKDAEVLVFNEANPAYALAGSQIDKDLARVPFKVSFTSLLDETSALCDLILPVGMGLERYDDQDTPYGCAERIYSLTLPVISLPDKARHAGDILLVMAKNLHKDFEFTKAEDVFYKKAIAMGGQAKDLAAGKALTQRETVAVYSMALRPDVLKTAVSQASEGLRLTIGARLSMGTASTAIPPFNTKTIRFDELKERDMYVSMNALTAKQYDLKEDDKISLWTKVGSLTARIHIFEGICHNTVAVPFGFGHTAFDSFSKNKGANVMEIVESSEEVQTGLAVWSRMVVNVTKI